MKQSMSLVKKHPSIALDHLSGVHVYYINLDRATERNNLMTSEARNLGVDMTRLEGVDGSRLHNLLKGSYTFSDGRVLQYETSPRGEETMPELGCMLSHLNAIATAYKNGDERALILEDDTTLYTIPMWKKTLGDVMTEVSDWGIISLCRLNYDKTHTHIEHVTDWQSWGAQAYLINRAAMKMVLDAVEWDGDRVYISTEKVGGEKIVSDDWINGLMIRRGKMYATRPMILPRLTKDMSSYINEVHIPYQTECAEFYIKDYVK